jgi:hypothetical protein
LNDAVAKGHLAVAAVTPNAEFVSVESVQEAVNRRRSLQLLIAGLVGLLNGGLIAWALARRRDRLAATDVAEPVHGLAIVTPGNGR